MRVMDRIRSQPVVEWQSRSVNEQWSYKPGIGNNPVQLMRISGLEDCLKKAEKNSPQQAGDVPQRCHVDDLMGRFYTLHTHRLISASCLYHVIIADIK
jgi:hypothetical protein